MNAQRFWTGKSSEKQQKSGFSSNSADLVVGNLIFAAFLFVENDALQEKKCMKIKMGSLQGNVLTGGVVIAAEVPQKGEGQMGIVNRKDPVRALKSRR